MVEDELIANLTSTTHMELHMRGEANEDTQMIEVNRSPGEWRFHQAREGKGQKRRQRHGRGKRGRDAKPKHFSEEVWVKGETLNESLHIRLPPGFVPDSEPESSVVEEGKSAEQVTNPTPRLYLQKLAVIECSNK